MSQATKIVVGTVGIAGILALALIVQTLA
ncbi:adenosine deaminase [Natronoarchaeum philippinense]